MRLRTPQKECTPETATRSCHSWPKKEYARWRQACEVSRAIRKISLRAAIAFTVPGCVVRYWVMLGWLCITMLCHTLGGSFNLPHAEAHAIVLPHALAYNSAAVPDAMFRIARALGSENAALGVFELGRELGISSGLREIGMQESDLDRACELALSNPYWNPRPIERGPLRSLLQDAWSASAPHL